MKRGFELAEILVVLAIVCILGAILYPVFQKAHDMQEQKKIEISPEPVSITILNITEDNIQTGPGSNRYAIVNTTKGMFFVRGGIEFNGKKTNRAMIQSVLGSYKKHVVQTGVNKAGENLILEVISSDKTEIK